LTAGKSRAAKQTSETTHRVASRRLNIGLSNLQFSVSEVFPLEKRWIWPFELLDKLGEGGMGVVYRARYVVDNRHVAVKLLPPDIANETILSRFERELEILKTLRHPNIVRSFGGVCEGNQHFYAMELVEGGTLDRLLEQRGKFSWEMVVQFALQMASALSYAHERGVVHRDVKPGNFLLTAGGKVKLSDFGLATVEAATKITAAGKTMGTFPYMAPEQIRGRPPVSPQTDLYALGCVIFEMLTGRTPFTGETPAEVMHKHLDQTPQRVTELAPDCPIALDVLVRDLLQKDPNDRPEGAYIVAKRLTDIAEGIETAPTPARTRGSQTTETTAAPRGIPVTPRNGVPSTQQRKWLVPGLIAILCLSLAWNVRSFRVSSERQRSEDLWIEAFRSGKPELRAEAAKALGTLARTSPTALAALVSGLDDKPASARISAIEGLELSGAAGRSAVPDLLRVQRTDDSVNVQEKATFVARKIQESPDESSHGGSLLYWILALVVVAGAVVAFFSLRSDEKSPRNSR
jgi:eukaryotic-like serine/threonine-protein kinase